ncbi:hypothetical protein [Kitasatospora sp. NPDC059327]|uniref:hypothetical protein n=1 Tax=Kitasatospora sp. NPDC059327 TaxID=3346803 RepID=UPI0036778CC7
MPTSANAATGDFLYKVGVVPEILAGTADPQTRECANLLGATALIPASHPGTSPPRGPPSSPTPAPISAAGGDVRYVMNPGRKVGNHLRLRSVVFSSTTTRVSDAGVQACREPVRSPASTRGVSIVLGRPAVPGEDPRVPAR